MHVTAANHVKSDGEKSAPSGGVSAQAPAPSGDADAKGGETPVKGENHGLSGRAAAQDLAINEEPPKAPPLRWKALPRDMETLIFLRGNPLKNPMRLTMVDIAAGAKPRWHLMDVPSVDPTADPLQEYQANRQKI